MTGPRTCVICNGPMRPGTPADSRLCGDLRCQWKFDSVPVSQRCKACGRPLAPQDLGLGFCSRDSKCQVELFQAVGLAREKREREQLAAIRVQAERLRDAAGVAEPGTYPLAVVPSFTGPLTELPEERRQAIRERLAGLIAEASEPPAEDAPVPARPIPVVTPEVNAVLGGACGQCRGMCCRTGRDHAYITVLALRRYREAHPEQGPEEVLAAYLSHVPSHTYEGSCVYHGPVGCTLPRQMRGDTCNRYFCEELDRLRLTLEEGGPPRAFVVTVEDMATWTVAPIFGDRISTAAFLDPAGARPVPVPTEEA